MFSFCSICGFALFTTNPCSHQSPFVENERFNVLLLEFSNLRSSELVAGEGHPKEVSNP
jgi:hypothetical protein